MGILDGLLGRRNNHQPVTVVKYLDGLSRAVPSLTPEDLYLTQDALSAVVDFLSRGIAATPLKVYKRKGDNDRERLTNSPAALLLANPNGYMTGYDLISATVHELKLPGEVLWLTVPTADSPSGWEIHLIRKSWITDTKTDGFRTTDYQIANPFSGKPAQWYPADNFISFANYNPSNPTRAFSYVDPLKATLREQIDATIFRQQVWAKGGRSTTYVYRPADAPEWEPEERDRWVKEWKERYTGRTAADAGGQPIMEDGMELRGIPFNAKDAEWSDALKLSRESVAGIYHVNPSVIWSGQGQSYASAKDNSRALYVDAMGPDFTMIAGRINRFLLPKIGEKKGVYVEFDIMAKLSGSFEEQSDIMTRSCGVPWMTINEVRGRMNLPKSEDEWADHLILPMNVIAGGQASVINPTNDGQQELPIGEQGGAPAPESTEMPVTDDVAGAKSDDAVQVQEAASEVSEPFILLKGDPDASDAVEITAKLVEFLDRQERSVESAINRSRDKGTLHENLEEAVTIDGNEVPLRDWFDIKRWNEELAADLGPTVLTLYEQRLTEAFESIGEGTLNPDEAIRYVNAVVDVLSQNINNNTFQQLLRAIDDETFDGKTSTVKGVFENAKYNRAKSTGQGVATRIRGWANIAAVWEAGVGERSTKTWRVHSGNPRSTHKSQDGIKIPYFEDGTRTHAAFPNGQRWPGDYVRGDAHEVAGCKCRLEIRVNKHK